MSKQEDKFEPTGEIPEYLSMSQAKMYALQIAKRDRHSSMQRTRPDNMVLDVVLSSDEEDFYRVRLSFRPHTAMSSQAGEEEFQIRKLGKVLSNGAVAGSLLERHLVKEPGWESRPLWFAILRGLFMKNGAIDSRMVRMLGAALVLLVLVIIVAVNLDLITGIIVRVAVTVVLVALAVNWIRSLLTGK